MKKIAIISNIQSNIYALKKLLECISNEQIEYVFNLGNFFDGDLFCSEIFDIISADARFINVLGEKERKVLQILEHTEEEYLEEEEIRKSQKIIETLGKNRINILKTFPQSVEIECEGQKIYAGVDTTDTNCVDYGLSEEKLAVMLLKKGICDGNDLFKYDYVFYGYHGLSEREYFLEPIRKDRETCYISPGNLYMQCRGKMQFTVIELSTTDTRIQQNNIVINNDEIIQAICLHNPDSHRELRKYGELNYVTKKEGDLVIDCLFSEPFKHHCKYREQYIELWKMLVEFLEEKCFRYYTSNTVEGEPDAREKNWTKEEKEKVFANFINEDGDFAWHEMGLEDKNGEVLFASHEFGTVYYLNNLDETQTREMIEYLNTLPNSREIISYQLY